MSHTPLFSCVIPVKGDRPFWGEAVDSLKAQGLGDDLEIIVQDADIEPDVGQSDALNKGFAKAKGEWLFWLNADDVLLPAAEKEWIEKYLGKRCPEIDVMDIKRFFELSRVEGLTQRRRGAEYAEDDGKLPSADGGLHLLYLGRRHPLKGVEYLEEAVRQIQNTSVLSRHSLRSAWSLPYGSRPPTRGGYASQRLCVRFVSNAFGEEKERVWGWCDVLVLPTLSENFGLVVAEALERGKRVITTDGAPAWDHGIHRIHGNGMGEVGNHEIHDTHEKGVWSGYGGRLIYLKGYRDGTDEERVELLKKAIERICK